MSISVGDTYQGRKVVKEWKYDSKTDPSKKYSCLQYEGDAKQGFYLSCSCPGWTRRNTKGIRECKHTLCTEQALGILADQNIALDVIGGGSRKVKYISDPTAPGRRKFSFE